MPILDNILIFREYKFAITPHDNNNNNRVMPMPAEKWSLSIYLYMNI